MDFGEEMGPWFCLGFNPEYYLQWTSRIHSSVGLDFAMKCRNGSHGKLVVIFFFFFIEHV